MNPSRLFTASRIALVVTAMSFAIRGGAAASWAAQFQLSNYQVGLIDGTAFWGFTLAIFIGGPLCDALGMRRILGIAFAGHLAGILLTMFAWNFSSLYAGTLLFGIAVIYLIWRALPIDRYRPVVWALVALLIVK